MCNEEQQYRKYVHQVTKTAVFTWGGLYVMHNYIAVVAREHQIQCRSIRACMTRPRALVCGDMRVFHVVLASLNCTKQLGISLAIFCYLIPSYEKGFQYHTVLRVFLSVSSSVVTFARNIVFFRTD